LITIDITSILLQQNIVILIVIIILIEFLTDIRIRIQIKKFCRYKFIYQKKDIQIVIRLDEKQKVAHKHRWRDLPGSCSAEHLLNNTLW
jgi:hypothetical protein